MSIHIRWAHPRGLVEAIGHFAELLLLAAAGDRQLEVHLHIGDAACAAAAAAALAKLEHEVLVVWVLPHGVAIFPDPPQLRLLPASTHANETETLV